jgi:hypothetical protein
MLCTAMSHDTQVDTHPENEDWLFPDFAEGF